MSDLIDSLKREHRAIESAIAALENVRTRMEQGEQVSPLLLSKFIDFIRRFADGVHHQKEEQILFPAMQAAGFPADAGPIHCMLGEHERGRALVREMSAGVERLTNGDGEGAVQFHTAAGAYAKLLTEHIYKEDNVLFRMAESIVGEEKLAKLSPQFAAAEARMGSEYEQLQDWAHGLNEQEAAVAQ